MDNQVRAVSLRLPADLLEKVDGARGDVNRNTYLVRLLEEAHAPTLGQTLRPAPYQDPEVHVESNPAVARGSSRLGKGQFVPRPKGTR